MQRQLIVDVGILDAWSANSFTTVLHVERRPYAVPASHLFFFRELFK